MRHALARAEIFALLFASLRSRELLLNLLRKLDRGESQRRRPQLDQHRFAAPGVSRQRDESVKAVRHRRWARLDEPERVGIFQTESTDSMTCELNVPPTRVETITRSPV